MGIDEKHKEKEKERRLKKTQTCSRSSPTLDWEVITMLLASGVWVCFSGKIGVL